MKKSLLIVTALLFTVVVSVCRCEKAPLNENVSVFDKYKSCLTIDDGFEISDFNGLSGEEFTYYVYEMRSEDNEVYWETVVENQSGGVSVIRQNREDGAGTIPSTVNLVSEIDANFDGRNDVLLYVGSFGNQGAAAHRCFLQNDDGVLCECESFPKYNVAVSNTFHTLRTFSRNQASEHMLSYYEFKNGEYVPFQKIVFTPHVLAYEYHDNASEWLGDDPTVYADKEYRCALEYVYDGEDWQLYKICENEEYSNPYEHKSICYDEEYEYINVTVGTQVFAGM